VRLIAGLGNPGPKYETTRHNVGFLAIDRLADRFGIRLTPSSSPPSIVGDGRIDEVPVLLAKPNAFMNANGRTIAELARANRIGLGEITVVHDDIDLAPGTVKWKIGGRDAGHLGVRSVVQDLGTEEFARVRIGVGRPPEGVDPAEYVLAPFSEEEWETLGETLDRAVECIRTTLHPAP
jgi:PTH1 family peptidyl-tRNA hydrolase